MKHFRLKADCTFLAEDWISAMRKLAEYFDRRNHSSRHKGFLTSGEIDVDAVKLTDNEYWTIIQKKLTNGLILCADLIAIRLENGDYMVMKDLMAPGTTHSPYSFERKRLDSHYRNIIILDERTLDRLIPIEEQ